MHGLVGAAHVDHLHPDSGIALATAADGEALTRECFGDRVVWVPWRRPGFQLGLDIAAIAEKNPQAIGAVLGGHGITAWGDTSEQCEANSLEIIGTAERFLAERGRPEPFGPVLPGFEALPEAERRARAAALCPVVRGLASTDKPQVGHFTDSRRGAGLPRRGRAPAGWPRWAPPAPTTSCAPRCARWSSTCRRRRRSRTSSRGWRSCTRTYRADYAAYYERHATADSPAMRGADPAIVLVPGVGMFSFGKDKQTARVAGEFYVNAINVMRGAEAVSTYAPIDESEKFRIEYWALEEAKLAADAEAEAAGHPGRAGHRRRRRASARRSPSGWPPRAPASSSPTWTWPRRPTPRPEIGNADVAVGVAADVSDAEAVAAAFARGRARLRRGRPGGQQRRAVDLEAVAGDHRARLGPAARRDGQGQVPGLREAARIMIEQGMGGDIVYISSKNSVFAGPNNIAYCAVKADQAHQVRLLAAELGRSRSG